MFFRLESSISSPYAIIDMEKFLKQYYDFFIKKEGNGKFLDYVTLSFKAQEGYSTDNIVKEDFLKCTIPIPIFSERFFNLAKEVMKGDLDFFRCNVICEQQTFPFYIGRILTQDFIVDESKSEYRKLRDGDNVLSRVVYHENDESNFFIARDSKELFLYTVTTQFKEFVLQNNVNIHLSPAK